MEPCIEWTGCRNPKGYGQRTINRRHWQAHRWAWTQAHGPIPPGMLVCHRCDNPPCVNVDHLFLGTNADNTADRDTKGRGRWHNPARGEQQGSHKLTQAQVEAIRSDSRSQRVIAADYGVNQSTISKIKRRLAWA